MALQNGHRDGRTVLISGGGIAGLTLAYWLQRRGLQPTIIEQAPRLRPLPKSRAARENWASCAPGRTAS